ncbi:MAG TPA: Lpg1974 family pore-forming outer membrane protein [Pirellulales bacterium]|nr:Lpg1974 family pore-forming outer membrane protein [Pirellulales bacterium]
MKLQTLQVVVAATLVCVGTPSHAQEPYRYQAAVDSAAPARSAQPATPPVYQYPTISVNAEAGGGPADQVPVHETDQLTYNDYYADEPTPADGSAPAGDAGATAVDHAAGSCCDSGCDSGRGGYASCGSNCCEPFWAHRSGFFAEALYLRPRGAGVAYAVPDSGTGPNAVPFGGVGTANPNYSIGYRGGATYALSRCASIQVAYTYYQSESNGSLFTNPPLTLRSLVTDPHVATAASPSLADLARYTTRFQFADVDYRRLLAGGQNWYVNYSIGTRYGLLTQLFRESQSLGAGGVTNVGTNINFEGAGVRAGLQGARQLANRGFLMYGKTFASILAGNSRGSYLQFNNFTGTQSASQWTDFRTVPILEYELGTGWRSANGRVQITAGYYFGVWFNTVSTSNYIQAVQTNNYVNANSAVTFDGLTTRFTYLW